jgi:hypothetical protein
MATASGNLFICRPPSRYSSYLPYPLGIRICKVKQDIRFDTNPESFMWHLASLLHLPSFNQQRGLKEELFYMLLVRFLCD